MNDTPADAMQLKPCPFCGEHCAALVVDQGDKWARYEPSCLEVRTGYDLGDNAPWRTELSAAWNTRTPSLAAQDGLAEALRHIVHLFDSSPITEQLFKPSAVTDIRAALASIEQPHD